MKFRNLPKNEVHYPKQGIKNSYNLLHQLAHAWYIVKKKKKKTQTN